MHSPAMFARIDPLVRLLLLAIVLASVVPVTAEWRPLAQGVSNGAVFLLFLLNGLRLPRADVIRGIGHVRFLAPLVLWCFGAMALAGWGLSMALDNWLPPLVALGFLYLGTLPSTVQSATAYTSLAGGNVANSVVAAALLNILGVFLTAPLFSALAGSEGAPFETPCASGRHSAVTGTTDASTMASSSSRTSGSMRANMAGECIAGARLSSAGG